MYVSTQPIAPAVVMNNMQSEIAAELDGCEWRKSKSKVVGGERDCDPGESCE